MHLLTKVHPTIHYWSELLLLLLILPAGSFFKKGDISRVVRENFNLLLNCHVSSMCIFTGLLLVLNCHQWSAFVFISISSMQT